MSDSESPFEEAPLPVKRGRPQGKADSTQRTRRTAQEISDDKIRIAQMKLDALKETEEKSWLIEKRVPLELLEQRLQNLHCQKLRRSRR